MSRMRKDEQGMVSILITMIMIIVISLIVLGFAQVTRHNQREALDDQLSTQAYYAAESGVNAAVNYLTEPAHATSNVSTTDCATFIGTLTAAGVSNTLDASTNTKYTCLIVNTEPTTLSISPLTQSSNTVLHLANTDSQAFTALRFQWAQQGSPSFSPASCNGSGATGSTLPPLNAWNCPYGILRLDIVDTAGANVSNATIENGKDTVSFYFIPSYNTGGSFTTSKSVSWPPATQPVDPTAGANPACNTGAGNCPVQIVPVSCTAGGGCSLQLNISGGGTDYYARLSMMYQDSSNVVIAGGDATHPLTAAPGSGVEFSGGQALIDSTGQSQDELRRVQVRIPLAASSGTIPAFGLQTTDTICKQLTDGPSVSTQDHCPNHP